MGGLSKVVSFVNKEVMQTVTESECLSGWFEYLKPWNGEAASTSRVVWLNCTRIPLEAWCFSTFKSIGSQWGNVLTLDRETSNRVRGRNYRVRIREEAFTEVKGIGEKTAVVPMVSGGESELELEEDSEDEGTDDITNKFQEEIHVGGIFDRLNKDLVEQRINPFPNSRQREESSKFNETGNEETIKEMGRQLKIRALRKSRRKLIVDLLATQDEIAKSKSVDEIYQFTGSREMIESTDLDSIGATASTKGINQRNAVIIREAEETIKLGKILGIKFKGNEMEILSWNIRGMGSLVKKRFIKKVIHQRTPDFVMIQESKLQSVDIFTIRNVWSGAQIDFSTSESEGQSGGLISMWRCDKFKSEVTIIKKHFIISKGVYLDNFKCCIVNVYAPNDTRERKLLWEELLQLKISFTDPWCLGGDLNEVRADAERSGYLDPSPGMEDLIEFINVAELHDLPLVGRRFTWTNFQASIKLSRLDRFLVSFDWCEKFNIRQWGLPRPISDHCPILISDEEKDWGPKIFRFMDAWLSHPKFMPLVKDVWENTDVNGWAGFCILKKMQALKSKLKIWNVEGFGNINIKLQAVEEKIHNLEMIEESRALDVVEAESKKNLKSELRESSRLAEILWRQKSRVNWIKLGDKNTRFFQASATARYRENFIGSVEVEGTWLEEPLDIKTAAVNFFSKLFNEEEWQRPKLEGDLLLSLDEDAIDSLESPFLEEEVVQAIKECDNLKAPVRWWWRFGTDKQSLWLKVIKAKYGYSENAWLPSAPSSNASSKVWENISSIGLAAIGVSDILNTGFYIHVGSGDNISFWNDIWCDQRSLKDTFPRLYSLSNNKEASTSDLLHNSEEVKWNLSFRRNLFVWEEELLTQLQQLLDDVIISNSKVDELRWRWDKSGLFSIKSFYDKWESDALQDNPTGRYINLIWRNICPYRVEVFAWMAWWGCSWVCPATIFDLMVRWFSNSFKEVEKGCWEAIFFAIIWSLWKARNELIFSNVNIVKAELIDLIKLRVAFWVKAKCDINEYSVVDIQRCLDGIRSIRRAKSATLC
ncbi:hypothetical protein Acr_28g0014860 [Actinidia rufa]|uniref:Endonuclease/exonuclease/phosphatase domain-containing protein n=1 Tax=Actinidia rufa TaxID=165716 RepID=A0A7J0HCS5_9ERIC|nr:hypothetical protein Acr_28g0014860 [Actinidia rufa]